jgi:hypothetical protein
MASKYKFNFDSVTERIKTEGVKGGFEKDKRFWLQEKKKENTVVIRFLPDQTGNPYVKVYGHSFSYTQGGKTKWYIENCLNTFGFDQNCPICEKNQIYYKSAFKKDNELAGERGRKLTYISNILIVKNTNNPEEEGKVFLYKYGKKIFEKIKSREFPTDADLQDDDFKRFHPYDLFEGANFKLKTVMQGEENKPKFPNYDQSSFSNQSKVAGGDEAKLDKIMEATHLLSEFIDEAKFPTNEKTLSVLGGLLGLNGFEEETGEEASTTSLFSEEEEAAPAAPAPKGKATPAAAAEEELPFTLDEEPAPPAETPADVPVAAAPAAAAGEDDDDAFFADFN